MHYILLHGTGGNPENCWFPWLRDELVAAGHKVSIPVLADGGWQWETRKDEILQNYTLDAETVLVGHSSGATAVLSVLEFLEQPIAKAILVAGYYAPLEEYPSTSDMIRSWDIERIQANFGQIVLINSENDPYGCDLVQATPLAKLLGAELVNVGSRGHMGSTKFNDPCKKLPLLLERI